ncbi:MAG: radical SAM protein [candidate division NC10 bacterium]|nr:radical SAM protein [candidate division NC10 bacterium]
MTLNVTKGCAHRCAYCYARGYRDAPPDGEVYVYSNLPERLEEELDNPRRRKALPEWVSLSTSCDPFQPMDEVLKVTWATIKALLERGIRVSFLTKGYIPGEFIGLFQAHPGLIFARVGLLSLRGDYHRQFEPGAARPEVRLDNIKRLKQAGVPVEVRHDPVILEVTDLPQDLDPLFCQLKECGIATVNIAFLHIRPGIEPVLKRDLPLPLALRILRLYRGQPFQRVAASCVTRLLPRHLRILTYSQIQGIASRYGIKTLLCACKNPDLQADICHIVGNSPFRPQRKEAQLRLFAI